MLASRSEEPRENKATAEKSDGPANIVPRRAPSPTLVRGSKKLRMVSKKGEEEKKKTLLRTTLVGLYFYAELKPEGSTDVHTFKSLILNKGGSFINIVACSVVVLFPSAARCLPAGVQADFVP